MFSDRTFKNFLVGLRQKIFSFGTTKKKKKKYVGPGDKVESTKKNFDFDMDPSKKEKNSS